MFAKPFDLWGNYTKHPGELIRQDRDFCKELYDNYPTGKYDTAAAKGLLNEKIDFYSKFIQEAGTTLELWREQYKTVILPFMLPGDNILIDYFKPSKVSNGFVSYWYAKCGDGFNAKKWKQEGETLIFSETSYNHSVDWYNRQTKGNNYKYWNEVNNIVDLYQAIFHRKMIIWDMFTNDLIPTATIYGLNLPPQPPTCKVQPIDPNGQHWQENYEAVINVFPLFKDHLPILEKQGYITIDDKQTFTWNNGIANLARYFDGITPCGCTTQWKAVKYLFGISQKSNLRAMVIRNDTSKDYKELCKILGVSKTK